MVYFSVLPSKYFNWFKYLKKKKTQTQLKKYFQHFGLFQKAHLKYTLTNAVCFRYLKNQKNYIPKLCTLQEAILRRTSHLQLHPPLVDIQKEKTREITLKVAWDSFSNKGLPILDEKEVWNQQDESFWHHLEALCSSSVFLIYLPQAHST